MQKTRQVNFPHRETTANAVAKGLKISKTWEGCISALVVNCKGGVAKTTSSLMIATALAKAGLKILCIDLDAQSNLSWCLDGLQEVDLSETHYAVLFESVPFDDVVKKTNVEGIDLLRGTMRISRMERSMPAHPNYPTRLRRMVAEIDPDRYDLIIMDCPPNLGTSVQMGFNAADAVLAPEAPGMFAGVGIREVLVEQREIAQTSMFPPPAILGVYFTRMEKTTKGARALETLIPQSYPEEFIFKTKIYEAVAIRDHELMHAVDYEKALKQDNKGGAIGGIQSHYNLAYEITERLTGAKSSIWQ